MIDNEMIKRARQADLAENLLSIGVPLVRVGNRYKHKEHDSLIFMKNAYYWNSRQEHGNAIDYLVRHMNMGFINAVVALAKTPASEQAKTTTKTFSIDKATINNNHKKIYTYLQNTRFIEHNTIDFFIANKLLCLEKQTNNAFFLMRDENNNCVGAEIQGTAEKRFKGVKANSKYGYGFNVRFSDDSTYDYALFFESAIDLLSFMDYKHVYDGKSLKRCILISMAGLKMNVIKHSLSAFDGAFGTTPTIVLCVDNDTAAKAFKNELERVQIKYIDRSPDKKYKD